MPNSNPVTFKWSNYTKPTPKNLKMFMEFWKGMIVVLTGELIHQDAPKWIAISTLILGYVIDRLMKFFAMAEEDEAKSNVTVSFPTEMADKVTITENAEPKSD